MFGGRPVAIKHCHAPLTRNPVLPFRSVWMPMKFAQTTRLNGDQGCSNIFRRQEVVRVSDANFTDIQGEGRRLAADSARHATPA
jgi:hypothetical protein